jgi:hypothetical protein
MIGAPVQSCRAGPEVLPSAASVCAHCSGLSSGIGGAFGVAGSVTGVITAASSFVFRAGAGRRRVSTGASLACGVAASPLRDAARASRIEPRVSCITTDVFPTNRSPCSVARSACAVAPETSAAARRAYGAAQSACAVARRHSLSRGERYLSDRTRSLSDVACMLGGVKRSVTPAR